MKTAQRLLLTGDHKIRLHGNFGYVERRSRVALVRAAYLLMFRTFGYRYVLDPSAAIVRAQLDNPLNETPLLKGLMWSVPDCPVSDTMVCVLAEPIALRGFLVLLRLHREPCQMAAVLLPPPGSDGAALYDNLQLPEAQGDKRVFSLALPDGFFTFVPTWVAAINGELEIKQAGAGVGKVGQNQGR